MVTVNEKAAANKFSNLSAEIYWEDTISKENVSKHIRAVVKYIQKSLGDVKKFIEPINGQNESQIKIAASAIQTLSYKQKETMYQLYTLISKLTSKADFVVTIASCFHEMNERNLLLDSFCMASDSIEKKIDWVEQIIEILSPVVTYITKEKFLDDEVPDEFLVANVFWSHLIENQTLLEAIEAACLVSKLNIIDNKVIRILNQTSCKLTKDNPYYLLNCADHYLYKYPWIGELVFASKLLTDSVNDIINEVVSYYNK